MVGFSLFGYRIAFGKNPARISSWACYYGSADRTSDLLKFDLCVLSETGQDPAPLRSQGRKALAYISLGELHGNSQYLEEAKKQGLLSRYNENWDSWVVDVRRPEWRKLLFDKLIPNALARGYDGLFFDTLDSPIDMQRRDPDAYKGTERACVELVRAIREKFPDLILCQNRGFEIIRRTAPYLDYLLIEGLTCSMAPDSKEASAVPHADRDFLLAKTAEAVKANPKLVVLSLDYAPADDSFNIGSACEFSRKQGFVPYVSTPALDEVFVHAQCF
ncbi:endo alpha-1,4 polygalactosaminidase [Maridesulfovibrio sp.]|uniref:endo alpha-1,4 polygalactosaminidase n=1 Tax=Maridesulfovibrio sp. TaxID=2795000 RepID=UPI002A1885F4|nr:endo alpha-1,4 polygalactosaminidase [Maridesulfovibrio sp.]